MPPSPVTLLAVSVAEPATIGSRHGSPVLSGILKRAVATDSLYVTELNLTGDRQADLRAHGGPEKAVYAYPVDHASIWTRDLGLETPPGPAYFGENLTIAGWTEETAQIGDVWAWGEALLQICQPRWPCYKLGMATGRPEIVEMMTTNGRCGWYLRVLRTGAVPVAGPITLIDRDPAAVSVLDAFRAREPRASRTLVDHALSAPALASALRDRLLERTV